MINGCIFQTIPLGKRLNQIYCLFLSFAQVRYFISLFAKQTIDKQQLVPMTQNLQQKNEQLKALCKKQQAQIAKLQSEIRQRYQSFYLHSSRFKKGQLTPPESTQTPERPIRSSSEIPRVIERVQSPQAPQKSRSEIIEEYLSTKITGLAFSKQLQVLVEPTKQDRSKEINEMAITIESFKNRIASLQNNKNQAVKQLQKCSNQIKLLRGKVTTLQKSVQALTKSQKKLKDKLKKLPEYEEKIDEIYIRLMKEVKKEEFNEQDELQKHFNQKLQEVIKWISQSKQKVDGLLQDFDLIESSQNEVPLQAPQVINPVQVASVVLSLPQNGWQQRQEALTSSQFSPMKTSSKIIPQNWTIISKINEVDIKPFDNSEVKSYKMGTSVKKEEEESIIRALQENSMIFEEQLNQTKKEVSDLKEQLNLNRSKNNKLAQELKMKALENSQYREEVDAKFRDLMKELEESRTNNEILQKQLNTNAVQINQLKEQLNHEKTKKTKLKQQLQNSPKISELQYSRLAQQVQTLKEQNQKTKLNITQPDLTTSKMAINEQLQAPYFVEEDLQTNPNDEYVKRSFIRKKIVRRNLSATAYRIVSKSKEEVEEIVAKKINHYRDISREKAERMKASERKDKAAKEETLQNSVNRISEVSEPRDSGVNHEEVRILQVTTTTPGEEIKSAKIYTKGGQANLSTRRKY